jgi:hypothetical protein
MKTLGKMKSALPVLPRSASDYVWHDLGVRQFGELNGSWELSQSQVVADEKCKEHRGI